MRAGVEDLCVGKEEVMLNSMDFSVRVEDFCAGLNNVELKSMNFWGGL